ncbi:hypothetical protein JOD43_002043 [Pullulanibacillus pueri]|nr:hypothetical protein [Pullulanibacillus pueri]
MLCPVFLSEVMWPVPGEAAFVRRHLFFMCAQHAFASSNLVSGAFCEVLLALVRAASSFVCPLLFMRALSMLL